MTTPEPEQPSPRHPKPQPWSAPLFSRSRPRRSRQYVAALLAATFIVAGAFAVGRVTAPASGIPGTASVEAGFARDMQTHHEQAVDLAMTVRDATADPAVRLLAYDIALSQSNQAGQLYGWITEWRLPQASPEPTMTWMTRPALQGAEADHAGMAGDTTGRETAGAHVSGARMPGLATPEQVTSLRALTGVAAEREFLILMIAHHRGGVEMADALLARSDYPATAGFARAVVQAQSNEITLMERMLAERE